MELKKRKVKTGYTTEGVFLVDKYNRWQGECIIIDNCILHGFFRNGVRIGKQTKTDRSSGNIISHTYYPLRHGVVQQPILEEEYKRELALFRLGEIECPHLSYLLKDYEFEDGKLI